MAGHRFELKFVADVENIVKDFQRVMGQLQQMASQMRIQIGVDFIGPNGPMSGGMSGSGGQGTNVVSSPGTTTRGGNGALRDIFGRPVGGQNQIQADQGDDRSSYQRFRQDDPALAMMMAQRAVKEREQHIALMTGGKTAGEFLSDRTRSLGGATDSESRATLLALQKFKSELDSTSVVLARLKKDREEALQMGDIRRASSAQTEIEERTRIKESIVQNAGGGMSASMSQSALVAGLAAATTTGLLVALPKITEWISSSTLAAVGQGAPIGSLNSRLVKTSFQTGEGLTMMDSNMLELAAKAGDWSSKLTPFNPMTYAGTTKQMVAGAFGGFGGTSPADANAARNASAYLDKALQSQAVQIESINLGFGRAQGRRGLAQSLGLSQQSMRGLSTGTFMPETMESGYTEADTLQAHSAMFGMNMGAGDGGDVVGGLNSPKSSGFRRLLGIMPGMKYRARATGMDLSDVARQTGSLMTGGGTEEMASKEQEEIVMRGVQRGVVGAGLVKQTDALVSLAQQAGGVGSVGTGGFNRIFDAASQVAGGNLGTDAGKSVAESIRSERTTRGGLQGLVNRLTADKTVRQMFPHLSSGVRDQAIRVLSFHDPSEWGSPMVWGQVQEIISKGLNTSGTNALSFTNSETDILHQNPKVRDDLIANQHTFGEQLQERLMTSYGGGSAMAGRFMTGGQAQAQAIRQMVSHVIAGGGGNMNPQQVAEAVSVQYGINKNDPTLLAASVDETKNAALSNRGIEAIERIITRLQGQAGNMEMVAKAIASIADNSQKAATGLSNLAGAVKEQANPSSGPARSGPLRSR